ncbi:MAG: PQQ-binding-like beta-propeller repeat protein [Vulcanimicrobiota bacterium]
MDSISYLPKGNCARIPGTLWDHNSREKVNVSADDEFVCSHGKATHSADTKLRAQTGSLMDQAASLFAKGAEADFPDNSMSSATPLWEFKTGGSMYSSPCIGPDGTVYAGDSKLDDDDNTLYAVKDGKKVWAFRTESYVSSSPCIGPDGTIYIGNTDGKLYAVAPPVTKKKCCRGSQERFREYQAFDN